MKKTDLEPGQWGMRLGEGRDFYLYFFIKKVGCKV